MQSPSPRLQLSNANSPPIITTNYGSSQQNQHTRHQSITSATKVVYSKTAAVNTDNNVANSRSPRGGERSPFKNNNNNNNRGSADLSANQPSMNEDISVFLNPKMQSINQQLGENINYIPAATAGVQGKGLKVNKGQRHISDGGVPAQHQFYAVIEPKFDLKQFRLVATDFLMSPILQNLFAKLWKLMIQYNYERDQIDRHKELLLQIPLRMDLYQAFEPIFVKGLGALYQTSQFICSRANNYPHNYVLFQRFCFDFISFSGQLLYQLTLAQYEYLLRKVFSLITFHDSIRSELCFRGLHDIGSTTNYWSPPPKLNGTNSTTTDVEPQLPQNNIITREMLQDIMTTQWSKRKAQIRHEYQQTLALEQEQNMKIKQQIDNVREDGTTAGDDVFDTLIDLSAIAEKAKEEKIRREERMKRGEVYKPKLIPFIIEGGSGKEDLNIVLQKDLAGPGTAVFKKDQQDTFKPSVIQQKSPLLIATQYPQAKIVHQPGQQNFHMPQKRTIQANLDPSNIGYQPLNPPTSAGSESQNVKAMLMYKQLIALAKNKEESESEDEEQNQQTDASRKNADLSTKNKKRVATPPQLIDSSESDNEDRGNKKASQGSYSPRERMTPILNTHARQIRQESKTTIIEQQSVEGGSHQGPGSVANGDDQFVKYVWNKKTKRLEKKDMRYASNLQKIDRKKFENFSKVNEKSKILSMQLQENYFNTTLLPTAISGDGEVNFKEIQEQMIYEPNDKKNEQELMQAAISTTPMNQRLLENHPMTPFMGQIPHYQKQVMLHQQQRANTKFSRQRKSVDQTSAGNRDIYSQGNASIYSRDPKNATQKTGFSHYSAAVEDDQNHQQMQQQQLVDKKLAIIRMALRGGSGPEQQQTLDPAIGQMIQNQPINDDYLMQQELLSNMENNINDYNNQSVLQPQYQGNFGFGSVMMPRRPQSLLETRDLFMRSKMHTINSTNKKLIQFQREQLKSSMQKTNYSGFNGVKTGEFQLPALESVPVPRLFKQVKTTSGKYTSSLGMRGNKLQPNNHGAIGNISVRLKIGQNNHTTLAPPPQRQSYHHGSSKISTSTKGGGPNHNDYTNQQSSPRSSNNNLDIIEYGVVLPHQNKQFFNKMRTQKLQADTTLQTKSTEVHQQQQQYTARDSTVTQNDQFNTSVQEQQQLLYSTPLQTKQMVDVIEQQQKMMKPFITPLNLSQVVNNNNMSGEGGHQMRQQQSPPRVNNSSQLKETSKFSVDSQGVIKKPTFINQLPMQDFQLEEWREAYKNINSATRHFYTGSSFPAVTKL